MISTGNDIVALKAINIARTKQLNFYSKFVTAAEKDIYDRRTNIHLEFENFVWLLWSVKESVYKYFQRLDPALFFSPVRIIVTHIESPLQAQVIPFEGTGFDNAAVYKGTASFGLHRLYFRTIISGEFIFSVVSDEDRFDHTLWGVELIDSDKPEFQSKAVRVFLTTRLNNHFPGANFHIIKSPHGFPVLLNGTTEVDIPVSLAHHDRYIAYSFQLK